MVKTNKIPASILATLVVFCLLVPIDAWAVAVDDDFVLVVNDLTSWIRGGLGATISLAAVIVGALVSIVRSNPLPILSGIAFAMILNFTPTIIAGIITGTI